LADWSNIFITLDHNF